MSKMNKALAKEKQQGRCQTSYPTSAPPRLSQVAHMATLSLRKQQRSRMSIQFLLHHGSRQSGDLLGPVCKILSFFVPPEPPPEEHLHLRQRLSKAESTDQLAEGEKRPLVFS